MDMERELAEIRREVIEGRNLVIRTDNLLKTLHSEVKSFALRQKEFERKQRFSSAAAYALFALLAGAAALLVSGARASLARGERDRAVAELKTLTDTVEKERTEQGAVAAARRSAAEAYRMMTDLPGDRRAEGLAALAKVDQRRLDPLERQALADRASALRRELGQVAYERGRAAFRRNDWGPAVDELTRFLAMQPPEQEQLDASFLLGSALMQQRKYVAAVPPLQRFVENDKRSKNREWAMALLAQAHEQTGHPDLAAAVAREALGTYPASQFSPMLRARLASAKRAMGGEGDAAPTAAAGAPTPAAPQRPDGGPPATPSAAGGR